jgi:hypothetical protein
VPRSRFVLIALGILLVVTIGAALWWRWPGTRPASGPQAPVGAGAVTPASTTELVLQINGMTTATVSAGASAFFNVTLTGPAPEAWTSSLRFETGDGKPLAFRLEPLGSPFTLRADGKETAEMRQTEFGISPEEAGRMSTGSHPLRAVLPLDGGSSGGRLLASNTVTLVVGAETGGASSSEKARLESAARFNLLSAKWQEAHGAAMRLVERDDADAAAFILLGDALNGLRRDREALAAYHEAFAALPKDLDESPDYLIARIEEVQQRLEAASEKKEPPI